MVLDKALMGSARLVNRPATTTQGATHVTEPLNLAGTEVAHWNTGLPDSQPFIERLHKNPLITVAAGNGFWCI